MNRRLRNYCLRRGAVEPEALRRGKAFHRRVQADWIGEVEGPVVRPEHTIRLLPTANRVTHRRLGRLDIFIDEIGDFVTVVEIKSTDWDRVAVQNRKRLLAVHRRQVLRYVDKYVDGDRVNVCAGIIYPRGPAGEELRSQIEGYLNDHGLQVVWYDEPGPAGL